MAIYKTPKYENVIFQGYFSSQNETIVNEYFIFVL